MVSDVEMVSVTEPYLTVLAVKHEHVPTFNFACGISVLDSQNIMIDRGGILLSDDMSNPILTICKPCNYKLQQHRLPPQALANYRWVGELPEQLKELTWLEEKLLARRHLVGSIVRLEERQGYLGLKGHMILVPQNTTELVNILPRSISSLPDMIRVVWTGKQPPNRVSLEGEFTINKERVYNALLWLIENNEDYKDVEIDKVEFPTWPPVFVTENLLNSMAQVMDPSLEDATRSGIATDDLDSGEIHGNLPVTTSGIIDVDNCLEPLEIAKLDTLKSLSENATINVVTGNTIANHTDDPLYFTSAFPLLFPYGAGKHKDERRMISLSFSDWVRLLLRNSSRYCAMSLNTNIFRRFQAHPSFVMLCFDVTRRQDNIIKSTIQTKRKGWNKTKRLLESLSADQLSEAAEQARRHDPITNNSVKELLKMIGRVGASAPGSSSKKWYMCSQLKSSTIYYGSPVIFLTLNPGERDSPITLKFAGKKINVREFYPEWYSQTKRLRTTLKNPVAVLDYFHLTVNTIIEKVFKGGLFGELAHFYGTIEYQGRGTPHAHILVKTPASFL